MACCATPLTLERTPYGWTQHATYSHPDLHDELVDELVAVPSPFAHHVSTESVTFTFLLLGDQNAGKSTFLHCFTHSGDKDWLQLASYLPILSSSFLNAALTPHGPSGDVPMDEPPFIDTDVGRASLLLTLEDFAFFADEFRLPITVDCLARFARDGARYVRSALAPLVCL